MWASYQGTMLMHRFPDLPPGDYTIKCLDVVEVANGKPPFDLAKFVILDDDGHHTGHYTFQRLYPRLQK